MNRNYRNLIISAFTFLGGIYFFLEFMLPESALPETVAGYPFEKFNDAILRGVQIVGSMAIGLGIINITIVHGQNIARTKSGWGNSVSLIFGMIMVFVVQSISLINADDAASERNKVDNLIVFIDAIEKENANDLEKAQSRLSSIPPYIENVKESAMLEDSPLYVGDTSNQSLLSLKKRYLEAVEIAHASSLSYLTNFGSDAANKAEFVTKLKALAAKTQDLSSANLKLQTNEKLDHFIFEAFFSPLGAAMFSLLAFYIASAAYRSFRIRSLEAFVMMIPAIIVMLGQIPHGSRYVSESLPDLRFWLLQNINAPAIRAITFGFLIASLAMAIRMWLSLEKSPLSSDDEEGEVNEQF